MNGLSPLARGTRKLENEQPVNHRFIPAGAGNTKRYRFWRYLRTVYPRWRREHQKKLLKAEIVGGLSPLGRGTHY